MEYNTLLAHVVAAGCICAVMEVAQTREMLRISQIWWSVLYGRKDYY